MGFWGSRQRSLDAIPILMHEGVFRNFHDKGYGIPARERRYERKSVFDEASAVEPSSSVAVLALGDDAMYCD